MRKRKGEEEKDSRRRKGLGEEKEETGRRRGRKVWGGKKGQDKEKGTLRKKRAEVLEKAKE